MKIFTLLFIFILCVTALAFASGDHGESKPVGAEGAGPKTGGHLAVQAFNAEDGFKLSDQAIQSLGIQFQPLIAGDRWSVSKDSLVSIKHSIGVYRKTEDGWITMVLVKVVSKNGTQATIQSDDLQAGDSVATEGVAFLRMTDADLNSSTVDGCAH